MICLRLLKVKFPVNSEQRKSALRSYWSGEWPNEPWLQQKQSRIYQRGRIYFIRPIKSLLCLCSADGILTSKLSTAPSFTTLLFILTIRKTSKTKMRFFFPSDTHTKLRINNGFQLGSEPNYAFFLLFVWKFSLEKASFCWISLSTNHEVARSYKAPNRKRVRTLALTQHRQPEDFSLRSFKRKLHYLR